MSKLIKQIIKKLFSYPFVWNSLGAFIRPKGVIVLMYHRVCKSVDDFPGLDVNVFREQMTWIKNNCNVIHPDNFKESVKNNNKYKPNVLITFDDGYQCCFEYAYPILDELSIPALVFLATEPTDEGGMIWTDFLYYLVKETNKLEILLPWSNKKYRLSNIQDKNKLVTDAKSYLKNIANDERVNYFNKLVELLQSPENAGHNRQMLNWEEVRDSLNIVCYGGHTHSHPIMSRVDEENLNLEIKLCKDRIYKETGIRPKYFAYPNGTSADYNELSKELLKKHGFELAYTTNEGVNDSNVDYMEIKRIPTSASKIEDFVWLISTTRG